MYRRVIPLNVIMFRAEYTAHYTLEFHRMFTHDHSISNIKHMVMSGTIRTKPYACHFLCNVRNSLQPTLPNQTMLPLQTQPTIQPEHNNQATTSTPTVPKQNGIDRRPGIPTTMQSRNDAVVYCCFTPFQQNNLNTF